jgi:hypothetical protein
MSLNRSLRSLLITALALPLVVLAGGCAAYSEGIIRGDVEEGSASAPIFVWTAKAAAFDGDNWSSTTGPHERDGREVAFLLVSAPSTGAGRDLSENGAYAAEPNLSTGYFVSGLRVVSCTAGSCEWQAAGLDPSLVLVHLDREAAPGTCAARRLGGPRTEGLHLMMATPVAIDDARAAEQACASHATSDEERRLCACEHGGDTLVEVARDTKFHIRTGPVARPGAPNGLRAAVVMR